MPNVLLIAQRMAFLERKKIGPIASEDVVIQLLKSKCIPVLLYVLEVCNLSKRDLQSLDFTVNRFFYEIVQY